MRTIYEEQSIGIIQEAAEEHGEGLYGLASFGNETSLFTRVVKLADVPLRLITIDSGFRMDGTDSFQERLSSRDGFEPIVYSPSKEDVRTIKALRLWETNLDEYHRITRYEPLRQAIGELGVTGLMSGIRSGQTAHRATLEVIEPGAFGETRIHPLLNWPEEQAERYIARHALLRHPKFYEGFGSIGDEPLTTPGAGRKGRELPQSECGLHVVDGRLVRAAA